MVSHTNPLIDQEKPYGFKIESFWKSIFYKHLLQVFLGKSSDFPCMWVYVCVELFIDICTNRQISFDIYLSVYLFT